MKNLIIAIVIIAAIAAGAYYAWGRKDADEVKNPTNNTIQDDEQNNSDESMMGDDDMNQIDDATQATSTPPTTGGNASGNGTAPTPQSEVKTFTLTGAPFAFSVKEIKVKQGDTVVINFSSTQGTHNWVVDEFNAQTEQVSAGTATSVTFVANKKGTFEYYCSVGNHRAMGMVGNLIVE